MSENYEWELSVDYEWELSVDYEWELSPSMYIMIWRRKVEIYRDTGVSKKGFNLVLMLVKTKRFDPTFNMLKNSQKVRNLPLLWLFNKFYFTIRYKIHFIIRKTFSSKSMK